VLGGRGKALAAQAETLQTLPDDPALTLPETAPGTPAGTLLEWWAKLENFPQAWRITRGDGAKVGVIDSGVDASHPDLAGKISYANDLDGDPGEGSAIVDRSGHGTHVAGLACAVTNNGIGLAGAGYDCRLLIEKSDLTEASVSRAIIDATNHGAQAINMSFGTEGSAAAPQQLRDAVRYAYRHNVVLVAAAADEPIANQGDPADVLQPPGTGPKLGSGLGLTVTSADFAGERSPFAGYGSEVSMAAYGSYAGASAEGGPPGILSTFPANPTSIESGIQAGLPPCLDCRTTLAGDNRYAYLAGTSMAAPQVTAVAAMIRQLAPNLSAAQIIELLELTAQRPLEGGGWNPDLGWGILDAGAAVSAARAMSHRVPKPQARPARGRYSHRNARCRAGHRSHPASRSSSGRCRT
jgi:subtilisin family serine protease